MPALRVVMPNGTTRSFREGTPKSVIRRAQQDMLADMKASGDYEGFDFSEFEGKGCSCDPCTAARRPQMVARSANPAIVTGFADDARRIAGNVLQRVVTSLPTISGPLAVMQAGGAAGDFVRNDHDMQVADTRGGDKYFHCKANCEASQRGHLGESVAIGLSDGRELVQGIGRRIINPGQKDDSEEDQKANRFGRQRAKTHSNCREACAPLRPKGLPERY